MATKADFTETEWQTMQRGLTGAGMLVSLADQDFSDSWGESSALAKYLAAQRTIGTTQLMRDLGATHGTGFGLTAKPDEVRNGTIEALRSTIALLRAEGTRRGGALSPARARRGGGRGRGQERREAERGGRHRGHHGGPGGRLTAGTTADRPSRPLAATICCLTARAVTQARQAPGE